MKHKIRLTADWTNPETGAAHSAGDIVLVHDWQLRLESSQGLAGKYSMRLEAPAAGEHVPRAGEAAPPPPATSRRTKTPEPDAPLAVAPDIAADTPPDNE